MNDPAQQRELDQRMYELNMQRILNENKRAVRFHDPEDPPELNAETQRRVKQFQNVDADLKAKYASFLSRDDTGVARIFPDNGCMSANLIKADESCRSFVPESSTFSFRSGDHADHRYGDVQFKKGFIVAGSFFTQGMIASLGDTPIESVTQTTPAVAELLKFGADADPASAKNTAARLRTTVESGGTTFGVAKYARPRVLPTPCG